MLKKIIGVIGIVAIGLLSYKILEQNEITNNDMLAFTIIFIVVFVFGILEIRENKKIDKTE